MKLRSSFMLAFITAAGIGFSHVASAQIYDSTVYNLQFVGYGNGAQYGQTSATDPNLFGTDGPSNAGDWNTIYSLASATTPSENNIVDSNGNPTSVDISATDGSTNAATGTTVPLLLENYLKGSASPAAETFSITGLAANSYYTLILYSATGIDSVIGSTGTGGNAPGGRPTIFQNISDGDGNAATAVVNGLDTSATSAESYDYTPVNNNIAGDANASYADNTTNVATLGSNYVEFDGFTATGDISGQWVGAGANSYAADFNGLTLGVTPAPEVSTSVAFGIMLGLGLAGLGFASRRKSAISAE